jgi:hypothetical protein
VANGKLHYRFLDGLTLCGRGVENVRCTDTESEATCGDCQKITREYRTDDTATEPKA